MALNLGAEHAAGELLVAPPEILPADVLASKQRSAQTQA